MTRHKRQSRQMLLLSSSLLAVALLVVTSCQRKDPPPLSDVGLDPETAYSMYTRDVRALVADSGITQYRLITPEWYVYNNNDKVGREAHWYFPHGLYTEQFDERDSTTVFVEADSAFYWTDRKLWELHGEVNVRNRAGSRFYSHLLYWDQEEKRIYTPDSVWIDTPERKIKGCNFESDEQFTRYTFHGSSGQMLVEDDPEMSE
ncbi:LPS export ABC transporter periplasmic protein LptC [Porphyromonas sp.]|uniref:LPS export ABC transporter periplasmic protein LptC n=1 Tax=Porphyromonas sp. TaxID=1924944 RepID=UPI003A8CF2A3